MTLTISTTRNKGITYFECEVSKGVYLLNLSLMLLLQDLRDVYNIDLTPSFSLN